jgi:molybdopterin converting factor subunit 1
LRVTVRLFARLRDLAGAGEVIREIPPGATAREVWNDLVLEWPGLRDYEKTISVAVNAEYARMNVAVRDGDEVAFMPPVSGGALGSACSTSS